MRSPSSSSFLLGWLVSFCSSGCGVKIAIHASGADQTDYPAASFRRPSNALRDAHILSSLVCRMGPSLFSLLFTANYQWVGPSPVGILEPWARRQRYSSEITARSGQAGKWLTKTLEFSGAWGASEHT